MHSTEMWLNHQTMSRTKTTVIYAVCLASEVLSKYELSTAEEHLFFDEAEAIAFARNLYVRGVVFTIVKRVTHFSSPVG